MTITFKSSISDIPESDWDRLNPSQNPFLKHAFLRALEASGSVARDAGWQPHHATLEDRSGHLIGACPLYIKSHSMGEYVFDHAWAEAFQAAGGRYYPKLLSAIPFTPVTTPKILGEKPQEIMEILEAISAETERLLLSSAHLLFLTKDEIKAAKEAGYLIRHDQQFHWQNAGYASFDDFLGALTSQKRKTIKKERAAVKASGLEINNLEGSEISEADWVRFYQFYLETCMKRWGQPYLTQEFFIEIGKTMPENLMLTLASKGGTPIAGALHIKGDNALYGRYWGALEHHDFLHFEVCYYQAIDYAIAHDFATVEAGAQGGHKLTRGYKPAKTSSAHWIVHEGFRNGVKEFLSRERKAVDKNIAGLEKLTPFKKV